MGYSRLYINKNQKYVDVEDYEDLNREQRKKAYSKFVVKHKKNIEEEIMGYYWFDKNGKAYQIKEGIEYANL